MGVIIGINQVCAVVALACLLAFIFTKDKDDKRMYAGMMYISISAMLLIVLMVIITMDI